VSHLLDILRDKWWLSEDIAWSFIRPNDDLWFAAAKALLHGRRYGWWLVKGWRGRGSVEDKFILVVSMCIVREQ
jgi:hypothetical protein